MPPPASHGTVLQLVLASGSPRRRAFLEDLGYAAVVAPTHIPEVSREGETPAACAARLARAKAEAAGPMHPDAVVLAADTVVAVEDRVLGKPEGEQDFRRMMSLLSDRTHQ